MGNPVDELRHKVKANRAAIAHTRILAKSALAVATIAAGCILGHNEAINIGLSVFGASRTGDFTSNSNLMEYVLSIVRVDLDS